MQRRQFIIDSSAAVGSLLPIAGLAALPCPPSPLSAAGGTQATTTCPAPVAGAYTTSFDLNENPINESGRWKNGRADGLDWLDIQTGSGRAYAAATVSDAEGNVNDDIACLTGTWSNNQQASAVIYRAPGYDPSTIGVNHEVELHVRCNITAHSIRTYECTLSATGPFIVRWNGPLGNITYLSETNLGYVPMATGQVLRATVVGNVISLYQNEVLICQATDSSAQRIVSGSPGLAFFPRSRATVSGYGFSEFTGSNL